MILTANPKSFKSSMPNIHLQTASKKEKIETNAIRLETMAAMGPAISIAPVEMASNTLFTFL